MGCIQRDVDILREVTSTQQQQPMSKSLSYNTDEIPPLPMKSGSILMLATDADKEIAEKVAPVYVVAFLDFEHPVHVQSIRSIVKERLFEVPRFRSCAMKTPNSKKATYSFRLMEPSDELAKQLVIEAPHIKTAKDLDQFASDVYSMTMPASLPQWRAYVINGLEDGRNVLCFVISHAIADGSSLVAALMSIMDPQPLKLPVPRPKRSNSVGCWAAARGFMRALYNIAIRDRLPADPPNKLKLKDLRNPSREKSLSMSSHLDLGRVKELAAMVPGATVNDVLMTVVCMTLRAYFAKHDPHVLAERRRVRANVPINLRRDGEDPLSEEHFGNRVIPYAMELPIHFEDPSQTLRQMKKQLDEMKASPEPFMRAKMSERVIHLLSLSTLWDLALDQIGKVTMMLSNVPGPQEAVYLDGQEVRDMAFYALAPIGVFFGVLSYNGKVSCGISTGRDCEPHAANISSEWATSFDQLFAAVMAGVGCDAGAQAPN